MNSKFFTENVSQKSFCNTAFLMIVLMGANAFSAKAQCHPSVDTTSVIVNFTDTIDGGFDPIWVCPNDTLISDGGFHNIYLEHGAVMMTGGGIDTIYVKGGAFFYMNGGIHVIYYVNDTDLLSLGGIPTLFLCDSLTFDYSHAPLGGCTPTGITTTTKNAGENLVYPNPATTKINFDLTDYSSHTYTVDIYNALGKMMTMETISQSRNSVNAENYDSGIYFYILKDNEEVKAKGKFIVE